MLEHISSVWSYPFYLRNKSLAPDVWRLWRHYELLQASTPGCLKSGTSLGNEWLKLDITPDIGLGCWHYNLYLQKQTPSGIELLSHTYHFTFFEIFPHVTFTNPKRRDNSKSLLILVVCSLQIAPFRTTNNNQTWTPQKHPPARRNFSASRDVGGITWRCF